MKKGDIVRLKEGGTFSQEDAVSLGYKDPSQIPETFEVEMVGMTIFCCVPVAVFTVEGYPDTAFHQDNFEVALPAGTPDVAKLMEESRQNQLAWIGM